MLISFSRENSQVNQKFWRVPGADPGFWSDFEKQKFSLFCISNGMLTEFGKKLANLLVTTKMPKLSRQCVFDGIK